VAYPMKAGPMILPLVMGASCSARAAGFSTVDRDHDVARSYSLGRIAAGIDTSGHDPTTRIQIPSFPVSSPVCA
jgi:hypothetical protein